MLLVAVALFIMFAIALATTRARAMRGYGNGIRRRHELRALFVSKLTRAFVGLTLDGRGLLLGDRRFEKVYPFDDVASAEVIHTAEKGRLRQLIVRVRVHNDDRAVHDYVLFDWPNDWGPKEDRPHVRAMVDQATRIRAMVAQGMERAA